MARARLKELCINRQWCKGCGICIAFCPKHVLELDDSDKVIAVRTQDCTACAMCALRCPDMAITVEKEEKKSGKRDPL